MQLCRLVAITALWFAVTAATATANPVLPEEESETRLAIGIGFHTHRDFTADGSFESLPVLSLSLEQELEGDWTIGVSAHGGWAGSTTVDIGVHLEFMREWKNSQGHVALGPALGVGFESDSGEWHLSIGAGAAGHIGFTKLNGCFFSLDLLALGHMPHEQESWQPGVEVLLGFGMPLF